MFILCMCNGSQPVGITTACKPAIGITACSVARLFTAPAGTIQVKRQYNNTDKQAEKFA